MRRARYEHKLRVPLGAFLALAAMGLSMMSGCTAAHNRPTGGEPTIVQTERLRAIWVKSAALKRQMRVIVYLPPGYSTANRYPVLYLLHGHSNIEDNWFTKVGIHEAYESLSAQSKVTPLIMVSPEIDNSWGMNLSVESRLAGDPNDLKNNTWTGPFEDWLYKDLVPFIDAHYATISDRRGRYIGGQSMGGLAALHLAFRHPDLFSKVGGHMPALWVEGATGGAAALLYPDLEARKTRDPLILAQTADLKDMEVYLDVGDKDRYGFSPGCERLYETLLKRGVAAEYHLVQGGEHSSAFVKSRVEDYLLFYAGR